MCGSLRQLLPRHIRIGPSVLAALLALACTVAPPAASAKRSEAVNGNPMALSATPHLLAHPHPVLAASYLAQPGRTAPSTAALLNRDWLGVAVELAVGTDRYQSPASRRRDSRRRVRASRP